jgi:GR25 family glycosyltransferase involved in LPS biosynthesis
MKSFVIAIENLKQSVEVADRCVKSAEKFNLDVEIFPAITPDHNPQKLVEKIGLNTSRFKDDVGSRPENVLSTFLSHYRLWNLCSQGKETYVIFEHDALLINEIPKTPFNGCMNIGAPSYGKWTTPSSFGVGPLTSKPYFPGAHAYMLKPPAAKKLCEAAQTHAMATDIFLQLSLFPWLEEYYPWPAIARDSFTTIQNKTGAQAKHNYQKKPTQYEFIKV